MKTRPEQSKASSSIWEKFWGHDRTVEEVLGGALFVEDSSVANAPFCAYEVVVTNQAATTPPPWQQAPYHVSPDIVVYGPGQAIPMRRLSRFCQNALVHSAPAIVASHFQYAPDSQYPSLMDLGDLGIAVRVPHERIRMAEEPEPIVYVFDSGDVRVSKALDLFVGSFNADSDRTSS